MCSSLPILHLCVYPTFFCLHVRARACVCRGKGTTAIWGLCMCGARTVLEVSCDFFKERVSSRARVREFHRESECEQL